MNRQQLLAIGSALLACAALVGCAADGGLAGHGKPVDKEATRVAICDGIAKANVAFQTIAAAAPGVIDQNGMDAEGAFLDSVGLFADVNPPKEPRAGSVCAKVYTGDINVAINTAIAASINITQLLAKWQG